MSKNRICYVLSFVVFSIYLSIFSVNNLLAKDYGLSTTSPTTAPSAETVIDGVVNVLTCHLACSGAGYNTGIPTNLVGNPQAVGTWWQLPSGAFQVVAGTVGSCTCYNIWFQCFDTRGDFVSSIKDPPQCSSGQINNNWNGYQWWCNNRCQWVRGASVVPLVTPLVTTATSVCKCQDGSAPVNYNGGTKPEDRNWCASGCSDSCSNQVRYSGSDIRYEGYYQCS